MALYMASINSGSNGNCYYVGNDREGILVDAGLSCKEIERRMKMMGLDLRSVKAILVTHEHVDHIKGVQVLSKRYQLPVYTTELTYHAARLNINPSLVRYHQRNESLVIGNFSIEALAKSHDASDPHSFTISHDGITIGVFTDIGHGCDNVRSHFSRCHAAFLEANYDEQMLADGPYPYYLKRRISGDSGHLSNAQALDIFLNHRSPELSHLILAHLSRENNSPQLVYKTFSQHAGNVRVEVASRDYAGDVFRISNKGVERATHGQLELGFNHQAH
jgi:phosphoribosyl 1,2-cyclic phosphodiesterase